MIRFAPGVPAFHLTPLWARNGPLSRAECAPTRPVAYNRMRELGKFLPT